MTDLRVSVPRALCFAGVKPSSYHLDGHLYAPLPVTYLERGVTSLGDGSSDNEGESRRALRVTYTSSGCCVSPVRAADGVLDRDEQRHDGTAAVKMRRLLCCRRREQVGHCEVNNGL